MSKLVKKYVIKTHSVHIINSFLKSFSLRFKRRGKKRKERYTPFPIQPKFVK